MKKRINWPKLDLYLFRQIRNDCLNTIYLTSNTQKAQRTYRRVLEGADVGVLWSYVVEETGEPGENHQPWTGDHYPATMIFVKSKHAKSVHIHLKNVYIYIWKMCSKALLKHLIKCFAFSCYDVIVNGNACRELHNLLHTPGLLKITQCIWVFLAATLSQYRMDHVCHVSGTYLLFS